MAGKGQIRGMACKPNSITGPWVATAATDVPPEWDDVAYLKKIDDKGRARIALANYAEAHGLNIGDSMVDAAKGASWG